jgi:hypothetical protein
MSLLVSGRARRSRLARQRAKVALRMTLSREYLTRKSVSSQDPDKTGECQNLNRFEFSAASIRCMMVHYRRDLSSQLVKAGTADEESMVE